MFRHLAFYGVVIVLAMISGCAAPELSQELGVNPEEICPSGVDDNASPPAGEKGGEGPATTAEIDAQKQDSAAKGGGDLCAKPQPGKSVQGKDTKKNQGPPGICQPQSLVYARCRSGIMTCRLGDTSPVQWFACAKKQGNIQAEPTNGSVMVLDINSRRKMNTGHPLYVESVQRNTNGTWMLKVSHTNYDRQCHLDQDAGVLYDPVKMTVSFQSGAWSHWARELKVLGFILR